MVDKADTVMHVFTVSKSATSKALNELREAYRRVLKWDEEDWWTRIRELKSMNMSNNICQGQQKIDGWIGNILILGRPRPYLILS